ncbi:MAG: FAD/NAD(P)-binding protein [Kribbellaceae bacterium]|nr:FAD/NAD(P)-binding protein [Kribbellaceae bacterium]
MLPTGYRVAGRTVETHDSATLRLEPIDQPLAPFRPGQFAMLYAYGVGEVPISISGVGDDGTLLHTVRSVGAVSRALHDAQPGTVIGVRGPFGTTWDLASGNDLVVVAGGVGLAPLRPVVLAALARRSAYRRVVLIAGARTPDEFLFRKELDSWAAGDGLEVELTIDSPAAGWDGTVGFVTEPLARLGIDPERTVALLCGPEPMMRFSARVLLRGQVPADRIQVSLERSMKCGIALCGHCQLGPLLVCRDGPVVSYTVAEPLLRVPQL